MIAICLPGGGAAGANQAGMLKSLSEHWEPGDIDIICGASVGALNGALYVQGDIQRLEEIWKTIRKRDIFLPIPTLWSLVWNKPIRNLIDKEIDIDKMQSKTTMMLAQACEYTSSKPLVVNQWEKNFKEALKASSAIPVVFPAIKYDYKWHVDGGVIDNTPLLPILQHFVETPSKHLQIIMLHCDPKTKPEEAGSKPRLLPQLFHTIELLLQAGQDEDTKMLKWWKDQQNLLPPEKRRTLDVYEIWPEENIRTLQFSHSACTRGFDSSYEIANKRLEEILSCET